MSRTPVIDQTNYEREQELAWQEHDLLERRRELEEICNRIECGRTTVHDSDVIRRELGLDVKPESPKDYWSSTR